MFTVLIALDDAPTSVQMIDLALELLAGREADITLLHMVPVAPSTTEESPLIIEAYVTPEDCEMLVAPLATQFHGDPICCRHPRLGQRKVVPRHLIHHGDQSGMIAGCDLRQERHASIALLEHCAQYLQQHRAPATRVTRDCAVGDPADVIAATAAHVGATLLLVGRQASLITATDAVWTRVIRDARCPVMVVPLQPEALPAGTRSIPSAGGAHEGAATA